MLPVERMDAHGGEFRWWVRAAGEVLVTAPPGREDVATYPSDVRRGPYGRFSGHVGHDGVVNVRDVKAAHVERSVGHLGPLILQPRRTINVGSGHA
jgi:hypothetical protein